MNNVVAQMKIACYKYETIALVALTACPFPKQMEKNIMNAPQAMTLTIPEAGSIYFGLCRNASYIAAHRGELPTVKIGRLYRVPIRALEQQLDSTMKPAGSAR
jgi:hypothetical protein